MVTKPYTIQAIGENESVAHVELTPADVSGVVKAFDAVNLAEHKSQTHEPLLWLWEGHLTHDQIPVDDFSSFGPGVWPVNYQWYYYYRTRSKVT